MIKPATRILAVCLAAGLSTVAFGQSYSDTQRQQAERIRQDQEQASRREQQAHEYLMGQLERDAKRWAAPDEQGRGSTAPGQTLSFGKAVLGVAVAVGAMAMVFGKAERGTPPTGNPDEEELDIGQLAKPQYFDTHDRKIAKACLQPDNFYKKAYTVTYLWAAPNESPKTVVVQPSKAGRLLQLTHPSAEYLFIRVHERDPSTPDNRIHRLETFRVASTGCHRFAIYKTDFRPVHGNLPKVWSETRWEDDPQRIQNEKREWLDSQIATLGSQWFQGSPENRKSDFLRRVVGSHQFQELSRAEQEEFMQAARQARRFR